MHTHSIYIYIYTYTPTHTHALPLFRTVKNGNVFGSSRKHQVVMLCINWIRTIPSTHTWVPVGAAIPHKVRQAMSQNWQPQRSPTNVKIGFTIEPNTITSACTLQPNTDATLVSVSVTACDMWLAEVTNNNKIHVSNSACGAEHRKMLTLLRSDTLSHRLEGLYMLPYISVNGFV